MRLWVLFGGLFLNVLRGDRCVIETSIISLTQVPIPQVTLMVAMLELVVEPQIYLAVGTE